MNYKRIQIDINVLDGDLSASAWKRMVEAVDRLMREQLAGLIAEHSIQTVGGEDAEETARVEAENPAFAERVRKYGSAECVECGAMFTRMNPCVNDSGFLGDLHIDGQCAECADKREQREPKGWRKYAGEPTNNDL